LGAEIAAISMDAQFSRIWIENCIANLNLIYGLRHFFGSLSGLSAHVRLSLTAHSG
jgi:hypothetical protein